MRRRQLRIRSRDYLVYRALWPKIEGNARKLLTRIGSDRRPIVLDIGCGERPYYDLFSSCEYIGLNFGREGADPDIVADAQQLPIASECVDVVFSTQVIEHLPSPQKLVTEAWRVLKHGGALLMTGPFYWPLHEEPQDFFRFTKYGFHRLLTDSGFKSPLIEPDCGSLTQVAVSLIEILPRWLSPVIPLINLATPVLQRYSNNTLTTLNYVVLAEKV